MPVRARCVDTVHPMSAPSRPGPTAAGPHRFGAVRLGDRIGDRDNNFDILRLLAAWAVLVSHSFALVGEAEPLHQLDASLGNVGVLDLLRRERPADPPQLGVRPLAARLLDQAGAAAAAGAGRGGPGDGLRARPARHLGHLAHLLLVVGDVDLPGADHPALPVRRRAARASSRTTCTPARQRPAVEPARRGLRLRRPRRAGRDRAAAPGGAGRRRWPSLSLVWAAGGSRSRATASARSTCSRPSRRCDGVLLRDRIVLAWPVALVPGAALRGDRAGPDAAPRRRVDASAAVYLCYWFAYAVPPWAAPSPASATRPTASTSGRSRSSRPSSSAGADDPWVVIAIATPIVWLLAIASWRLVERPALRRKPRPTAAPAGDPVTSTGSAGS